MEISIAAVMPILTKYKINQSFWIPDLYQIWSRLCFKSNMRAPPNISDSLVKRRLTYYRPSNKRINKNRQPLYVLLFTIAKCNSKNILV